MENRKDFDWRNMDFVIAHGQSVKVKSLEYSEIKEFPKSLELDCRGLIQAHKSAYEELLKLAPEMISVDPFTVSYSDTLPVKENGKEIHVVVNEKEPYGLIVSKELYDKMKKASKIFATIQQHPPGTYFESDRGITLNL